MPRRAGGGNKGAARAMQKANGNKGLLSSAPDMFRKAVARVANVIPESRVQRAAVVEEFEAKPSMKGSASSVNLQDPSPDDEGLDLQAQQQRMVFADAEQMKREVREALVGKHYTVSKYYHETGVAQALARSKRFDFVTLIVIGLNGLWIAVDSDHNNAESLNKAAWYFQVAEQFFCTFFVLELLLRFAAFAEKWRAFTDAWFLFDFVLVFLMVLEDWVFTIAASAHDSSFGPGLNKLSILRLLRMMRFTRMLKFLGKITELMILVKAMLTAIRAVSFSACLLGILVYIFAVTFRVVGEEDEALQRWFPNVPGAAKTLVCTALFMDDFGDLAGDLFRTGPKCSIPFLIFVILGTTMMLNFVIGFLVSVVQLVGEVELEEATYILIVEALKASSDGSGPNQEAALEVSMDRFVELLSDPRFARVLKEVGVDPMDACESVAFLFRGSQTLAGEEFLERILQLRGSNKAKFKDIVELRKFIIDGLGHIKRLRLEQLMYGTSGTSFDQSAVAHRRRSAFSMEAWKDEPMHGRANGAQPALVPSDTEPPLSPDELEAAWQLHARLSAVQGHVATTLQQLRGPGRISHSLPTSSDVCGRACSPPLS